jgi:hypothetical protein
MHPLGWRHPNGAEMKKRTPAKRAKIAKEEF